MILTKDYIDYIAAVTDALNKLPEAPDGYYLAPLLMDAHDHAIVSVWIDEFGSDNWYFDTTPPKDSYKPQKQEFL